MKTLPHQMQAPAEQVPCGAHGRRVDVRVWQESATKEDGDLVRVNLVVLGLAPMDGLHGEGVAEDERDLFGGTEIVTIPDPDHSDGEARFLSLGLSARNRILVVAYTEREGTIRLVHARVAGPKERRAYEQGENAKN